MYSKSHYFHLYPISRIACCFCMLYFYCKLNKLLCFFVIIKMIKNYVIKCLLIGRKIKIPSVVLGGRGWLPSMPQMGQQLGPGSDLKPRLLFSFLLPSVGWLYGVCVPSDPCCSSLPVLAGAEGIGGDT